MSDKRLIEDYLPIEAISAEASREKSVRKGHISTLHLWWARRPLVACRAAVYGALVSTSRFDVTDGPEEKRTSLSRSQAAEFVERLCKYPGDPRVIADAQQHILEAHAERLTQETNKAVSVADIVEGRAPRPKVLDMFAGGGAIPLEALRLGCEAYALDLNPVAHIIELCTLVYPQKYGKPDKSAKGSAPDGTWAGLADEVRYWGNWVLEKVKAEIGDLYPLIPDPQAPKSKQSLGHSQLRMSAPGFETTGQQEFAVEVPTGYLTPVAYLWTRAVRCKNPACGATVPLVKQTWLCKRPKRYVALKVIAPKSEKQVRFEVVEATTEKGLGFDPSDFSEGGNATCPFCGTVADSDYVKGEGLAGRLSQQMMAMVCIRAGKQGKVYLSVDEVLEFIPGDDDIQKRTGDLYNRTGLRIPDEPIITDAKNCCWTHLYGLTTFRDLFLPRQLLCLLSFAAALHDAEHHASLYSPERWRAIATSLACWIDRLADFESTLCTLKPGGERGVVHSFTRQAIPMVWDFAEANPFGTDSANALGLFEYLISAIRSAHVSEQPASVRRGLATDLPFTEATFDAVITDPPYYDNIAYADLSDFFFVWLKRTIGHLYPEHFATEGSPKKNEAVADATRYGGSKQKAKLAYESMMAQAFGEAYRVLKPDGQLVVVYAHKTTLGWSTLVDALRRAGLTVTEAWPLDTEMRSRLRGMESAALASSIFLVARKREGAEAGSYEDQVRPDLERTVRERVETLWDMGIVGADLVIAAVGAGLRAFTRFARVEYANGEEVPAEKFLAEVEGVVLESLLEKIFGVPHSGVAAVDGPSRFYVLWRFTYKAADLDAGEAIVFTYGQPVELDGAKGISNGTHALAEKKKGKYRLRDYSERGDDGKLGLPDHDGHPAPLIDTLHRILWLMENEPRSLARFLDEARPDRERLRLVAQALAGAGLKGKSEEAAKALVTTTASEQSALGKLLANWRTLIESHLVTGQENLFDTRVQ